MPKQGKPINFDTARPMRRNRCFDAKAIWGPNWYSPRHTGVVRQPNPNYVYDRQSPEVKSRLSMLVCGMAGAIRRV